MSQSYPPGTILSFGFGPTLEQVIVLTEDKVATKTFAGHPVTRRDIMSLADWRILAQSLREEIQTDYLPLPPNPLLALLPRNLPRPANTYAIPESGRGYLMDLSDSAQSGSSSALLELNALLQKYGVLNVEEALAMTEVPVAQAVAEPETHAIGTKLSWKQSEGASSSTWYSPNSRTAIVVKNGILQVKEVIDGTISKTTGPHYNICSQKFFSCLADWKATLPAGGVITISTPTENFSLPSIKRKAIKPIVAETDVAYIEALKNRYAVHSGIYKGSTPVQQRENLIAKMKSQLHCIKGFLESPTVTSIYTASPANIRYAMYRLAIHGNIIARLASKVTTTHDAILQSPESASVEPILFRNNYRQRIMGFVGGREVELTSSPQLGLLGLAGPRELDEMGKWFKSTTAKTFAQLGLDLKPNGYPRLKVYYRRESIEL
jgi:hypothetical protein